MSTEDKERNNSSEVQDQGSKTVNRDSSAPRPESGAAASITLFFFIGLAVSLVLGWVVFPQLLYSQKEQPIKFNHAMHNELVDNGCES